MIFFLFAKKFLSCFFSWHRFLRFFFLPFIPHNWHKSFSSEYRSEKNSLHNICGSKMTTVSLHSLMMSCVNIEDPNKSELRWNPEKKMNHHGWGFTNEPWTKASLCLIASSCLFNPFSWSPNEYNKKIITKRWKRIHKRFSWLRGDKSLNELMKARNRWWRICREVHSHALLEGNDRRAYAPMHRLRWQI